MIQRVLFILLALVETVSAYTLTVSVEHGSVVKYPDEADYDSGDRVRLTSRPAVGYCFDRWSGDVSSEFLVVDIVMDGNKSVTAHFKTWVPPIGIPVPTFGISETYRMYDDPARRNPALTYGASLDGGYYTHYVDSTDTNATNTSNDYGSISKPRTSIPTTLPEGSVVEIHNSISGTSLRYLSANGTAERPVFVRGVGSLEITGGILIKGSYSIWEGLILHVGSIQVRVHNESNAHHVAVRNNTLYGDGVVGSGTGLSVCGSVDSVYHDIVFYGNHIHHGGDSEAATENDNHGIGVGSYVEDFWMVDNHVHHMGGDSVQVSHGANFTTHEVYIGRNVMHDDRENAVDIKQANHVVVSQNEAWGYEACSSAPGEVFVVHYDPHDIYWFNNTVSKGRFGIVSTGCSNQYIVGNLICDMTGDDTYSSAYSPHRKGIGIRWYNTGITYVVNNTIVNCEMGIGADVLSHATAIVNNIIADVNAADGYHISIQGTGATSSLMTHNLVYQEGQNAQIYWIGIYNGLAAFQTGTGKGEGCLETNPLVVATGSSAFALTSASPAIEAGTVSSVYADYETAYGLGIYRDAAGTLRPQGSGWDIGAYEYEQASTQTRYIIGITR